MKVVSAIIEDGEGRVLLAERPPGKHLAGSWEFPGGKVEPGETSEMALRRELKEELELDIRIVEELGVFPYTYDFGRIELHVFRVQALNSPQTTVDVQRIRWLEPSLPLPVELAPADVEPWQVYLRKLSR